MGFLPQHFARLGGQILASTKRPPAGVQVLLCNFFFFHFSCFRFSDLGCFPGSREARLAKRKKDVPVKKVVDDKIGCWTAGKGERQIRSVSEERDSVQDKVGACVKCQV